jgi:DNA-binding response OmpR family regulator/HPt (histidine-containing phosphotransfer) domain-containing protein
MSAPNRVEIDQRLLRLRKSYGATLHERVERLQQTVRNIRPNDEKRNPASLEEARALAHSVAGSAATFGYPQVGQIARALEYRLQDIIASRTGIGKNDLGEIEELLQQLAREEKQAQLAAASQSASARHHRLLVVQGRRWLARDFVLAFERNGFEIQISDDYESTLPHAETFKPDVLIITVHPDELAGFELAERFWSKAAFSAVEVLFFMKSQDFLPKILLNGISDEWFLAPPFDSQELASRILRRIFNIKVGRESNNRPYLAPYLETFKKLATASGDPVIVAAPALPPPATESAVKQEGRPANLMRKRVLVVDDDKYLVEAICEVLQDTGVQLLKAYSGFQGVQLATREAPDLIITDFEMPNGSAEYLLSILRQSEATRPIKVIVMTGHEVLERYRLSQNPASFLKVVSFQPKPLDLEGLCVEVRRQLAVA